MLISFDVVNLFPSVPVKETLAIVKRKLEEDESLSERTSIPVSGIMELLSLCLTWSYFRFGDEYFLQTDGLAMGSSLSPILANIFMTELEETVLARSVCKPSVWKRYVDDCFAIIPHTEACKVDDLLTDLNSYHDNIKFTLEYENEGSLPFLDVLIVKADNYLRTSVYRKPTHTNQYLAFSSNHPIHVKKGIVKCLKSRAIDLSSHKEELVAEIDRLFDIFRDNGYPAKVLGDLLYSDVGSRAVDRSSVRPLTTVTLEYIPNFSEMIRRVLAQFNIRTVFKSSTTLRSLLCSTKPRDLYQDSKNVIYMLPCQCDEVYIGETSRPLAIRIKEHEANVKSKKVFTSLVADHALCNGHRFQWSKAVKVYKEVNSRKRKFIEAAFIECCDKVISQSSFYFASTWQSTLSPIVTSMCHRAMDAACHT